MAPSRDVSVERWRASRSFHHSAYPAERVAVERDATVSVRAAGGEAGAAVLERLLEAGVVDEVIHDGDDRAGPTGDVVAFVDAAAPGFGEYVVCGIVGPVVCEPGAALALAATPGGRLAEITAKPLLRRRRPDLAGLANPLARELAVRRPLLDGLPDPATSEAAGLTLLLAVHAARGLRGLAQVDLGLPAAADDAPLGELAPVAEALLEIIESAA